MPLLAAGLLAGCVGAPPLAPAPPYHAVGVAPGWTLLIDDREVTFIGADQNLVRQPRPAAIAGAAGQVYQTPRIQVNIMRAACTLGNASAVAYPDRVQVTVDGHRFTGCGGL